MLDRFVSSAYFELVGEEATVGEVEPWLLRGDAQVALVIGRGFGDAVAARHTPAVQLIADGTDSTAGGIALSYASRILQDESIRLLRGALRESLARRGRATIPGNVELVSRVWYNPDLRSRWFYVPAVLALILMVVTMVIASMGVVREKEIGTMEQVIVTPIRSWQLIIGKLFPFAVIGLFDTLLVTGVAVGWFQVPLRGSLILLVGLTMLFLLNTLGLSLLVSTIARTQQQAMMGAAFMLLVPMVYLGGLIFPIENMPETIQVITYVVPLRYYAAILRGIFVRGSGIDVLWPEALALAASGVTFLTLASIRFRKRLE